MDSPDLCAASPAAKCLLCIVQALHKYKQKRKNLNFTKKIRYESRKQLAQARPRVKGQFVRMMPGGPELATVDSDAQVGTSSPCFGRAARGIVLRARIYMFWGASLLGEANEIACCSSLSTGLLAGRKQPEWDHTLL